MITIILAGLLAGASAVPALAATEDKPKGLERALQSTQQALEFAADDRDEALPTVPPGHARQDKENPGKGPGDKGNAAKGNPHGDAVEKATGRARAAAAIASAMARENGNGHDFGRGHALEVIDLLLDGKTPDALEVDENHGPELSAMVRVYNELKAKERAEG